MILLVFTQMSIILSHVTGGDINVTAVVGIAAAVIVFLASLAVVVFLVIYCRR